MYAKVVNNKAFSNYNDYINMSEEQQAKYVMDYGEIKPFVFEVVTAEEQRQNVEEQNEAQKKLREMYRSGGKLDND